MMINRDSRALQIILCVATAFCARGAVLFIQRRARVILRVSKGVLLLPLLPLCVVGGHFIYLIFYFNIFRIAARCKPESIRTTAAPACHYAPADRNHSNKIL